MFEFIATAIICYFFGSWLMQKLAKRPDAAFRGASFGCGVFLVVSMTVTGIVMWNTPGLRDGFTVYFFLWAMLGVVLMVKGIKGR
ncbi:MAG: hypothetical protein KIS67_01765 [Verrucomicrobiae bacterium]|nr:hypothetical protein [Verrucomicrobiae bacterium]